MEARNAFRVLQSSRLQPSYPLTRVDVNNAGLARVTPIAQPVARRSRIGFGRSEEEMVETVWVAALARTKVRTAPSDRGVSIPRFMFFQERHCVHGAATKGQPLHGPRNLFRHELSRESMKRTQPP